MYRAQMSELAGIISAFSVATIGQIATQLIVGVG